jgi:hypothetical protein
MRNDLTVLSLVGDIMRGDSTMRESGTLTPWLILYSQRCVLARSVVSRKNMFLVSISQCGQLNLFRPLNVGS